MKRIFLILTVLALMPFVAINAQDERNRTASTIIADALAQLPAENVEVYNQVMSELAGTGAEGVEMLATMLQPAAEGVRNSAIEYALNGTAAYVSKGNETLRAGVREGLKNAFPKVAGKANQAFVMTVLEICATAEDADFFASKLSDEYFGDFAARSLATIKGTEKTLIKLMKEDKAPRELLAQIASYKGVHAAEPFLIHWLASNPTPEEVAQINMALASCGCTSSIKVLAAAAKKSGYAFDNTDGWDSYLRLLNKLVAKDPKSVEKAAKGLMKNTKSNVKLAGLDLIVQIKGNAATPYALAALKSDCREWRYGALRAMEAYADNATYNAVAAAYEKASQPAKVDILNWLGANHAEATLETICAATASADDAVASAAIVAASKIGGADALAALVARMSANNSEAINDVLVNSLLSFNGKINTEFVAAMDKGEQEKAIALKVLAQRCIPEAADKAIAWAKSDAAAEKVLVNVATEKDFATLCEMLEGGKNVSAAVSKSIQYKPIAEQVKMVEGRMAQSSKKSLYYPILASTGAAEAIAPIVAGYKAGDAGAFESLLKINDESMIKQMLTIAQSDAKNKEAAWNRYLTLTAASKKLNNEQKYMNYRNVLMAQPSVALQNKALTNIASTQSYPGMMLAAEYMENEATAQAAANTILQIATKHPEFYSAEVKALLEKVSATLNDGDAVYKRKDIEKFISENKERESHSIITELSAEEKAEGFELLFDGKNMDKWEGNLTAYQPIDGYMYVTAAYGSAGNLYTKKEYKDFVFRFEFCFDRAGINNGVGIRTPVGVDAAYHGMEIQILDHDDPIYKNLKPHQVHGSVYGIIAAKRIVSPELGTWNTEEIRIKGDHITVTVNGEVIVDGNIRKACKGHNVAPDGSGHNPYTVDNRNHPGLFNEKGRIGFLGHGNGLKLRNVRVKELK